MDDRDDPPHARAPEPADLARICRALNEAGARYVGASRFTKDIDLMGRACGLSYDDVAADAEQRVVEGVTIPIASPATLMRTKDTFRPQDQIDRAFLERVISDRQQSGG